MCVCVCVCLRVYWKEQWMIGDVKMVKDERWWRNENMLVVSEAGKGNDCDDEDGGGSDDCNDNSKVRDEWLMVMELEE